MVLWRGQMGVRDGAGGDVLVVVEQVQGAAVREVMLAVVGRAAFRLELVVWRVREICEVGEEECTYAGVVSCTVWCVRRPRFVGKKVGHVGCAGDSELQRWSLEES